MSEKPLPCPFCGGEVEEFHEEVDIGVGIQHGPSHHHCLRCEAQWGDYRDWPTRRCEDEPKNAETQLKAWVEGFMLGLRQQGMDRWEAKKRVLETAEKWHPERYSILKGAPDDWFY